MKVGMQGLYSHRVVDRAWPSSASSAASRFLAFSARWPGNASGIGSLRAINSGQAAYLELPNGGYAPR